MYLQFYMYIQALTPHTFSNGALDYQRTAEVILWAAFIGYFQLLPRVYHENQGGWVTWSGVQAYGDAAATRSHTLQSGW